jgi:type IV secretory pathway VirB3-like protein
VVKVVAGWVSWNCCAAELAREGVVVVVCGGTAARTGVGRAVVRALVSVGVAVGVGAVVGVVVVVVVAVVVAVLVVVVVVVVMVVVVVEVEEEEAVAIKINFPSTSVSCRTKVGNDSVTFALLTNPFCKSCKKPACRTFSEDDALP